MYSYVNIKKVNNINQFESCDHLSIVLYIQTYIHVCTYVHICLRIAQQWLVEYSVRSL